MVVRGRSSSILARSKKILTTFHRLRQCLRRGFDPPLLLTRERTIAPAIVVEKRERSEGEKGRAAVGHDLPLLFLVLTRYCRLPCWLLCCSAG